MLTIRELIVSGDIHLSGYDTIPSFLAKIYSHEMELALQLGDPRVGYEDEVEDASRVSALFGRPVLEVRHPDGVVCPAFDVQVLQAVLLGGPAPKAKLLKRAGVVPRKEAAK